MRDFWKDRGTRDWMLAAAVTTLAFTTATVATAQTTKTPAELAIDAAVPVPEPANVIPPSPSDFAAQANALATGSIKSSDGKQADTPSTDAKTTDVKTTDAKPADIKAPDTKTTDTKPADTPAAATASAPTADAPKAADSKPADAKPAEVKQDTAKQTPADSAKPAADTAKTDTAKPASTVAEADQPVADKLHDLIPAKASKYFDRKVERTAVENFYTGRSFAPLWTQAGQLTDRARGVIERLKAADKDGLEVADYPVPDFAAAKTPDDLADAELKLTASMLDYARQAQSGRVHWSRVSADIAYPDHPVDPTDVLVNISTARDVSAALQSYNPPQPLYRALRAKLAELRGDTENPPAKIDEGQTLKFTPASGKKHKTAEVAPQDPRVPTLRARLAVENPSDDHYDQAVANAVRKFQNNAGLDDTGVLNNQTIKALNSPKRDRQIDTVLLNMERWRWLPRNLGEPKLNNAYVILNIPDYTLKVMQGGKQVWTTRVVTGKPGIHATPLLSETMKFITVNPTWNVPPSIIQNEYLPALAQDPTVLERMGLRLETERDGSVHISQPPGDGNALGRIRFNFPNKFLVYQHDTPDKYLFAKDERAYSHGCMRVQYPDQYAEVLLGITDPQEHYTVAKIHSMYGSAEQNINFPTPIPVHITYQTAFVDEAGKLEIRKDVYGRDGILKDLLKGGNRVMAEIPVEHSQQSYSTRPKVPITQASSNGPGLFGWLFSAPQPPPQPTAPVRRPHRSVGPR
jgi:murein L,D-transpeptidase YcbB/YkuD